MIRPSRVFLILLIIVLGIVALATFASGQTPPVVRVAVIPVYYDAAGPPAGEAQIRDAMAEALGVFVQGSSGTTSFPVLIGAPYKATKVAGQCFEGYTGKAIAASGLAADKYLLLTSDGGCRYGGEAAVGGGFGFVNAGTASYVIAHELGHMLGLNHANAMDCILPGNLSVCRFREYGDPIDVMAGGSTVQAMERASLGWPISFLRHTTGTAVYAMADIEAGGGALFATRDDGLTYAIELRQQGFFVRFNYDARYNYVVTLKPGPDGINYQSTYRDVTGGVQLRAIDATHLEVARFAVIPPTPDPRPPTPVPTWGPQPTPKPDNECWVLKPYLRCSPTPTQTALNPIAPSPTMTAIPPPPVPTSTPAPGPPDTPTQPPAAATETPASAASPTQTPAIFKTPVPIGSSGCGGSKKNAGLPADSLFVLGAMLFWRRRSRS